MHFFVFFVSLREVKCLRRGVCVMRVGCVASRGCASFRVCVLRAGGVGRFVSKAVHLVGFFGFVAEDGDEFFWFTYADIGSVRAEFLDKI